MSSPADIPRPEYPRPQFERAEWLNLNGVWSYTFDHGNSGIERKLNESRGFDQNILVPFCPESPLSGVGYTDFITCIFYHRRLAVPESWRGKRVMLNFGAVDYLCEVFIDGAKVEGTHHGGSSSFSFDITTLAAPGGEYDLVVRAFDDLRSGVQAAGKQSMRHGSFGCFYTRVTGIWQTVWLEAVAPQGLKSCHIVPDFDNSAFHFTPEFYSAEPGVELKITVFADGKSIACASGAAAAMAAYTLPLTDARPWSTEDPFLYDIVFEVIKNGEVIDRVSSYAGLRKIHIEGKRIFLNNKEIYQRLVLDQGFYPDGIWTAPSDAALKRDIELAMQAGFNGARLHQKVFEERFHYWADKLGYLTWAESASWGVHCLSMGEPASLKFWRGAFNFLAEWREIVLRDRNHPSIITWTPTNETWISIERDNTGYRQLMTELYDLTKSLDATRPINDASGYHHVKTDLWTVHYYLMSADAVRERLLPPDSEVAYTTRAEEVPYSGQPYLIDEWGGFAYIPPHLRTEETDAWGYGGAIASEEEYLRLIEEQADLFIELDLAGYCYTQLTDVEQEQNGVYRYDRTPKNDIARLRRIFTKTK